MSKITYKRILLKVSGEVLMGNQAFGIDLDTVARIADEVIACVKAGAEVALVIGGGNIFRGVAGGSVGWLSWTRSGYQQLDSPPRNP